MIALFMLLRHLSIDADRIRFAVTRPYYESLIAAMPRDGQEPLLARFDWGGTGGAGVVNIFHVLVFDESDELTQNRRSAQWWSRAAHTMPSILNDDHTINIRRLGKHFYLVTEIYQ
ncbi:MAG: hypothetical protein IT537_31380 [Hyphomicrobiales bacterium]|nr:hypothetical protein [Hyphomicrobiales bacterium]